MKNLKLIPSRLSRFSCLAINSILAAIILTCFFIALHYFENFYNLVPEGNKDLAKELEFYCLVALFGITMVFAWFVGDYQLSTKRQGSIGHTLLNLRVVSKSGKSVSVAQSIFRFAFQIPIYLSFLFLVLMEGEGNTFTLLLALFGLLQILSIFISVAFNKQTIADIISGTQIIYRE